MKDKPTFDTNVIIYAFGKHDDALRFFVKYIFLNPEDIQKIFPGKDLQLN